MFEVSQGMSHLHKPLCRKIIHAYHVYNHQTFSMIFVNTVWVYIFNQNICTIIIYTYAKMYINLLKMSHFQSGLEQISVVQNINLLYIRAKIKQKNCFLLQNVRNIQINEICYHLSVFYYWTKKWYVRVQSHDMVYFTPFSVCEKHFI